MRNLLADHTQRLRSRRLTTKSRGTYQRRPRSIGVQKPKKFVVCVFREQMGAARWSTATTPWPQWLLPCRNLDLRYVRACEAGPFLSRADLGAPPPHDEIPHHEHDRDDEQEVNRSERDVDEQANHPQNHQDHGNAIQ